MTAALCQICGGYGRDGQNRICTHCSGTGNDPYLKAPGSGGSRVSRRSQTVPPPRSVQAVVLVLALGGAAVSYLTSGGSMESAGLGFLVVLVTGLFVFHLMRNLFAYLVLAAGFYGLDQALWDGQALPWAWNAAVGTITQLFVAVF